MFFIIFLPIFLQNFSLTLATYLTEASNFIKPQLERNNIVNKGVWMRDPKERLFEKSNVGDFIFRTNSLDADSLLQNSFDAFGDNGMQSAQITSYIERSKRSASDERKRILRESLKECNGDKDCVLQHIEDKAEFVKSKLLTKLKPTSVFNDYPYEVAILLADSKIDDNNIRRVKESANDDTVIPLNKNSEPPQVNIENLVKTVSKVDSDMNYNENNITTPKRSMKNAYESEIIKKIEITEELPNTNGTYKVDRGIFDKDDRIWHQSMPMNEADTYKIVPKYPMQKSKPINERGLIKVLSMLTKTFKKTMKQHADIKKMHNKLHVINDEVNKNLAEMNNKFKEMEEKYLNIINISDKMKLMESNMNIKEEYFKAKESEMSKNMMEFENQQKKFLIQQRQFYNIQKLMLAQNEKINVKQNLIARTQSEISHRQNNFARILKKAKQIYMDNKLLTKLPPKLPTTTETPKTIINETEEHTQTTHTSTQVPPTTESVKINLFSIPALDKLVNQDSLILKDKDEQQVDDLVYKYYFNNTFIDNLMKSKVLSSFMTTPENAEIARNAKKKREDGEIKKTILLPVNKVENEGTLTRERRWIRHLSETKLKRKQKGKNSIGILDINDEKPIRSKKGRDAANMQNMKAKTLMEQDQAGPFKVMAKNFCNEIGQNANAQMLNWCIEKALRRLKYMDLDEGKHGHTRRAKPDEIQIQILYVSDSDECDNVPKEMRLPVSYPVTDRKPITTSKKPYMTTRRTTRFTVTPHMAPLATGTKAPVVSSTLSAKNNFINFPDNDELETNLKQFDMTPDTEGNVYYDGSLHASNIVGLMDSDGFSDIMPGLDSNSKVEIDPQTFDFQTRRRDVIRRMNAMKNVIYG